MNKNDFWKKRIEQNAILDPIDRISEVLFGLIMVLSLTGTISISNDGRDKIQSLLWGALGCNIAWGVVDAIMYLMNILFQRGHSMDTILKIRKTSDKVMTRQILKNEISPLISGLMTDDEIDKIGESINRLPEPSGKILIGGKDFIDAIQIFLLVFICILPVTIPFGIFKDAEFALRISNCVALIMLFAGGYKLAGHAGFHRFLTALIYMLVGLLLVSVTMAFGG